jgi:hypothetical protein
MTDNHANRAAWNRIARALVSAHNASNRQCEAIVRIHSAAVKLAMREHESTLPA